MKHFSNYDSASEQVDTGFVLDDVIDCSEEQGKKKTTLSENQRYGVLAPVTQRLLEAMVKCGTEKVHQFKSELELMVERVKAGENLLPPEAPAVEHLEDVVVEKETGTVEQVLLSKSN